MDGGSSSVRDVHCCCDSVNQSASCAPTFGLSYERHPEQWESCIAIATSVGRILYAVRHDWQPISLVYQGPKWSAPFLTTSRCWWTL